MKYGYGKNRPDVDSRLSDLTGRRGGLSSILPEGRIDQPMRVTERFTTQEYKERPSTVASLVAVQGAVLDGTNGGTPAVWATMHGLASATNISSTFDTPLGVTASTVSGDWSQLSRGLLYFDTSKILEDGGDPLGATLRLWIGAITDAFSDSLVVSSATGSATITLADFDQIGSMEYATRVTLDALTNWQGRYRSFPLNGDAVAALNPSGVTQIGLWLASDADDSEPSWSSNASSDITFGATDSAYPPILEVTYNG